MHFYEVWVRSSHYHGSQALTYQAAERLPVGGLVAVPMQRETVLGYVSAVVPKPSFKTKTVTTVFDLPTLPAQLPKLADWLKAYYPAPLGLVAQQLLPTALSSWSTARTKAYPQPNTKGLPLLTADQAAVIKQVNIADTYILHGTTGSGKTRVYIELAAQVVTRGLSALVLTPEISLTSQLAERFREVFGSRVIVLHSQLTPKERRETWQTILEAKEPIVVIGPRSILFSPVGKLGLIVLDESHEPAYKQGQAPHYQTARVAAKLRELHDATLVLGSATPSIQDYYLAAERHKPILQLQQLAQTTKHTNNVQIIDLKDHNLFPRSSYLSEPLTTAITAGLQRGEQTLLYLNRRGTARVIVCENCGWQATCPHCDLPLTYHGDTHELRCHVCGFHTSSPSTCPDCGKPSIIYKTIGTKAVVDEVHKLFPNARVQRFDTDNRKSERFEQHYEAVHNGDVDILIGTQLLAKGLDLPKLSVLGVLMADTSLQMPDFSATERTFQLLSQVLGRVGRGHVSGQAFVQTYQSDSPIIKAAIENDWDSFYATELLERRRYTFPPFCFLLKLTVRRTSIKTAEKSATDLAAKLRPLAVTIEGPAPAFHEKLAGKYQYQLIIKAKKRSELVKIIADLPNSWSYDIDPVDLM